MTCEEYRHIADNMNPEDATRALRATFKRHYNECKPCRKYLTAEREKLGLTAKQAEEFLISIGKLKPGELGLLDVMWNQDTQDPEFREVAFGEDI